MALFQRIDVMLPQVEEIAEWAVIACDQFSSQPEYWNEVRKRVGERPSTLHLVLPEAELAQDNALQIANIHNTMDVYLNEGVFREYADAYIYVERTLTNGMIRKGVIGAIDLEAYNYHRDSDSWIRATEHTVEERIPPRKRIREGASIELSHILLLCDDKKHEVLEALESKKEEFPVVYDLELMKEGGHITGRLVQGKHADLFDKALQNYMMHIRSTYEKDGESPIYFAVGDGNHSLATAKLCYEEAKKSGNPCERQRYAMVELENIHDPSQKFEPIHRLIKTKRVSGLLEKLKGALCCTDGYRIEYYSGSEHGVLYLDKSRGELSVSVLQPFLDDYLNEYGGEIDYIHGEDTLIQLSRAENTIGFILPAIEKDSLFSGIAKGGVLPRKTFSMGHAQEKRYYLEARRITNTD